MELQAKRASAGRLYRLSSIAAGGRTGLYYGRVRVPLLACPAVLNYHAAQHCWTSQQWHPHRRYLFTQSRTEIDYTTAMAEGPETTCTTRRRWLRLTPDRVVWALLPLEGLLILSEWFRWFPFNQHKGWTVLVAIAGLGAVLLLMFLWFLAALVFRLRFQFSILSLLVLTVVVAVPFSWLKTEMNAARRQRETVEWIKNAGGEVVMTSIRSTRPCYTPGAKPPGPAWLRNLLGDDVFADVTRPLAG